MAALFILLVVATSSADVQAQSPCSISGVNFYPQPAYAGQTVSITTQVTFICGPSYENVWKVRIDISNTALGITSTNSTQYVYASYANTRTNVTNIFTAPQKDGELTLGVTAYVIAQSNGKVYASTSSALTIHVLPVAVTYTTTTQAHPPSTTMQASTSALTTSSITESGFSLSTDQIYMILALVLTVFFIVAVATRLRKTLRDKPSDRIGTIGPGPT